MAADFAIDARVSVDVTTPFWHRADPMVRAVRIDPGFAGLRRVFPATWRSLVAVKSVLDSQAVLATFSSVADAGRTDGDTQSLLRQLVGRAAALLRTVASRERSGGRDRLADSVDRQAETLHGYAQSGEWPPFLVDAPVRHEPWIYCGPLSTWAPRRIRMPLGLLVVLPEPEWQGSIDLVDMNFEVVREAAAAALGQPVRSPSATPAMLAGTLILAGGESSFGHKNFAHFFPLETPGGSVTEGDFTVVFGNVHRARLAGCSLPMLDTFLDRRPNWSGFGVDDVLKASLAWFRCHDLGHFWRADHAPAPGPETDLPTLSGFVSMALEETYADVLGVLCARRVLDPELLNVAFGAELLRYLSRRMIDFADTVAATIEVGWFAQHGFPVLSASSKWLDTEVGAALSRTIHAALWGHTDPAAVLELRNCLPEGRKLVEQLRPLYTSHPTDLIYTFG